MLNGSIAFKEKDLQPSEDDNKTAASQQNALLSLLSQEDFSSIRNQIHVKIRDDKIDENPAGEDADEGDVYASSPTSNQGGLGSEGVVMSHP